VEKVALTAYRFPRVKAGRGSVFLKLKFPLQFQLIIKSHVALPTDLPADDFRISAINSDRPQSSDVIPDLAGRFAHPLYPRKPTCAVQLAMSAIGGGFNWSLQHRL